MKKYLNNKINSISVVWFASLFMLISSEAFAQSGWPRLQAENFAAQTGGATPAVTENSGASVGYFDEKGETLRYSINVPASGYYTLSYKYLSGATGEFVVRTASGAEGFAGFNAVVNPSGEGWWLVPFSAWPTKTSTTQFYFAAGAQDLFLVNQGVGVNLDYIDFALSPNQALTVDRIEALPASLTVKPNHSISVQARAYAGTTTVAVPLVWSANVLAGTYRAGAAGTDSITVSTGNVSKIIPVSIQMPRAKFQFVVSEHGALHVQTNGSGFLDKNNNLASFAGPSWFWSDSSPAYWTKAMVDYFVQDWKSGLIRLPMSIAPGRYCDDTSTDSTSTCFNIAKGDLSKDPITSERGVTWNKANYFHNPEASLALMKTMIDAAIENDIYVVVDFHEHHAGKLVPQAKAFFEEIAKLYGTYPNVMFEIYNEPLPMYNWSYIANYAKEIIPVIRKYSNNPIIVGTSSWSQDVDQVDNQLTPFGNIAYTLHYYAKMHGNSLVGKMDLNKPVMITESGNDAQAMTEYVNKARAKGISWASWAVNNKTGNPNAQFDDYLWSIFTDNNRNYTGPWTDADLRAAGKTQRDIIRSWPRTPASPTALCDDNLFSIIKFVANGATIESGANITLDLDDSLSLTAYAYSSCKFLNIIASGANWSANAPSGVFSANVLGTFNVSLVDPTSRVVGSITINVVPPRPFMQKVEAESLAPNTTVQTESTSDVGGGLNVGFIDAGDAMAYTVTVPKSGMYKMSYRVASQTSGGNFELRANQALLEVVSFTATNGWQSWKTVETMVDLPAGKLDVVIKALAGGWNINWFQIDAVQAVSSSSRSSVVPSSSSAPKSSTPMSSSIPASSSTPASSSSVPKSSTPLISSSASSRSIISTGITVEAESYLNMSGVQTEATSDIGGGSNLGWLDAGDWMAYPVNIPATGSYKVSYRIASQNGGGMLQLEKAGGSPVYGSINVPSTGAWQGWQTISHVVALPAGQQNIAIAVTAGGWNINWIKIEPVDIAPTSSSAASSSSARSSIASSSSSSSNSSSSIASRNQCTLVVGSDWGSGFSGTVRFTNKGTTAINGWNINWAFTDNTRVTESWNAVVSGSNPYSASNISWNGSVQPGQTVEFGFNATKGSGAWNAPVFGGACL